MNVSALSEELIHKTVERLCARFCCFADPVNGEPGLKRCGDERTGRLWVHVKGVRVLTEAGAKICKLCVCTRKIVGDNSGMQPITHKRGTFCDGKVVVKNQHLFGGSDEIECHEAEPKLRCSSCGLMSVTDPRFLSACVMAAGDMGCRMLIC